MKIISNSKEITTLEVGDKVVFSNLEYVVDTDCRNNSIYYYLCYSESVYRYNGIIFEKLNLKKRDFIEKLGIDADCTYDFPETKSLEALTAVVSALFKEYEKKDELPKTWEAFCMKNPIQDGECYIDRRSNIEVLYNDTERDDEFDRNVCTSKQEAEAFLALMQLRQLRKAYVKDWESDWTNYKVPKYGITCIGSKLSIISTGTVHRSMSFPTYDLAEQFLDNFKDLLEIAKPLL